MSDEVDLFIDSDSFTDQKLLDLVQSGKRITSLTLVRYLSRGIVNAEKIHIPNPEVIKELLDAGGSPFHFSQRHQWELMFADDIRAHMPVALRSTINLAALIHDQAIMDLLLEAGETPNRFTRDLIAF